MNESTSRTERSLLPIVYHSNLEFQSPNFTPRPRSTNQHPGPSKNTTACPPSTPCSLVLEAFLTQAKQKTKTYNSGYSPVVTHLTTNPPVHCLSSAERTGSSVLSVLWSYVKENGVCVVYIVNYPGVMDSNKQSRCCYCTP
jgi:hypothetical protein